MTDPRLPVLQGDCARCDGLCCMALALDKGPKFACDKPAGIACVNLNADYGCAIHDTRVQAGYSGCLDYDCLGAGQVVCTEVLPDVSWRDSDKARGRVIEAFRIQREVHRLIDLLRLAGDLPLNAAQQAARGDLLDALLPPEGWSEAAQLRFDSGDVPKRVATFLTSLREVARGRRLP